MLSERRRTKAAGQCLAERQWPLPPSCPDMWPLWPPFPSYVPSTLQIMEVASPTAGSVLVELSQLQLLQVCGEVTVRTMSPHGESADSIPAPVPPALVAACLPATVSCPSPRPSSEARLPLAPASPGPGDPSSPVRCPDSCGTREPPGGPPAREIPKGSHEEEPVVPCSQVPCWGKGGARGGWKKGLGLGPFLSACHSRRRLQQPCWVPQRMGGPASQPGARELLTLQLCHWPRKTLSGHPAPAREHWPSR